MMYKSMLAICFCLVLGSVGTLAQNTFPSTGNVGIGMTSPTDPLVVNATSSNDAIMIERNAAVMSVTGGTQSIPWYVYDSYDQRWIVQWSGSSLSIPSGNLGIGTTSPRTSADIVGANATLNLDNSAGNGGTVGIQLLHVGGSTTQQKVAIFSDATGEWGRGNLRFAVNINNDLSNVSLSDTKLYIDGTSGNVGIGTTNPGKPLDVAGTIRTSANGSDTGGVFYPDGTQQTTAWTGVLCGGDYAEAVDAGGDRKHYEPGDVLVLGSGASGDVEKSAEPYSTMVAGVFATKPGVVGRRETLPKSNQEIPMAMVGIVPTKVSTENGPIRRGDLLVSSSTAGYAMKGTDRSRLVGAVIGKAMGSLDSGEGVIEVLVTLQ